MSTQYNGRDDASTHEDTTRGMARCRPGALADGGPDAVRVDVLAQTLGVTRGGFYHQFDSRQALLDELLDTWERRSTDEVLEQVEREGGDARTKVGKAGMLTFSDALLPIDLAVRNWARRDAAVRPAAPRRQPQDGLPA
jgi:AcrR family transcriptional regulator